MDANEQANNQASAQQQQEGGPQQDEQNEPPRQTQQEQAAAPKTDEQRIREGVDKMGRTVKNKVQQIAATARPHLRHWGVRLHAARAQLPSRGHTLTNAIDLSLAREMPHDTYVVCLSVSHSCN